MTTAILYFFLIFLVSFSNSDDYALKVKGEKCRLRCEVAANYASGLCAGLSSFGAPLTPLLCTLTQVATLLCTALEGVLWAFGGYCTSTAPTRHCEYCLDGLSYSDLYDLQLEIDGHLANISQIFDQVEKTKDEMTNWLLLHKQSSQLNSLEINFSDKFEDIDHLLFLLLEVKIHPTNEEDQEEDFALAEFNRTVFSPGKNGVLNLIHQFDRLVLGGAMSFHLANQSSVLTLNPGAFCAPGVLARFERVAIGLYQAFFFGAKINNFGQSETEKFRMEFSRQRELQRKKVLEVCGNLLN